MSGPCGNVCEKKLQTKLESGSECVSSPVRTHTRRRSICRTCSVSQRWDVLFLFLLFLVVLVEFEFIIQVCGNIFKVRITGIQTSTAPGKVLQSEETMQPPSGTHNHDNCVQTQLCGEFVHREESLSWIRWRIWALISFCLLFCTQSSATVAVNRRKEMIGLTENLLHY